VTRGRSTAGSRRRQTTLHDRGWRSRRIQDDDVIWEFTHQGLAALDLNSLRRNEPADLT
jgi:hypothetical protein